MDTPASPPTVPEELPERLREADRRQADYLEWVRDRHLPEDGRGLFTGGVAGGPE